MSGSVPTPALAASNITGSLGSTIAGIGLLANTLGTAITTTGLPTTSTGWFSFALQALMGAAALFSRA